MSTPIPTVSTTEAVAPDWLRTLVFQAVAEFAQRHLPGQDALIAELGAPRLDKALGLLTCDWRQALRQVPDPLLLQATPLRRLARDFQLQTADLFVLALCGEVEQSHALNLLIAALQAPDEGSRPTLHLLSALLQEQFDIVLPPGRLPQHLLVHSGLLQCEGDQPMPLRTLRIDPRLWNLLTGGEPYWPGIEPLGVAQRYAQGEAFEELLDQAASQLRNAHANGVIVRGDPSVGRHAAVRLAQRLGLTAMRMPLDDWQSSPLIAAACRYAGWLPVVERTMSPGEQLAIARYPLFPAPPALLTGADGGLENRDFVQLPLPAPGAETRGQLWHDLLGEAIELPTLANAALLDAQRIAEIARQVRENLWPAQFSLGQKVALARSQLGTQRLRTLAHPVERHVEAEALVLSPAMQARFDALLQRCEQREHLWRELGPTMSNTRNPGVRVLFSGDSGTGKTLAASRLASALHAPLFRLDMASLMNKYVGETEKNLSALLDEAAAHDVILLLDEADALFGKRSDGDSGGERFANMLTNFLLTRIEAHPGIVVLTSNSQARIDDAFTRRFDAVLEFSAPAFEERRRLWANHLGARSPGEQACRLLASYCDLPGGAIRNAVLNAAALQPLSEQRELQLPILVSALHEEYRKLGRSLPPALDQLRRATDA